MIGSFRRIRTKPLITCRVRYLLVELRSLQRLKYLHVTRPFVLLPAADTDGIIGAYNPKLHGGLVSLQLCHVGCPQVGSPRQGFIRQQTSARYAGHLARGRLHATVFRYMLHPDYRQQHRKKKSSRHHAEYCYRYAKPTLFCHATPPAPALLQSWYIVRLAFAARLSAPTAHGLCLCCSVYLVSTQSANVR